MEKLKERWGITSNLQIILILIVFAINGSLSAWLAKPAMELIGLYKETTNGLIYWPLRILIIFPVYQLTLPIVGYIFGQFKFFWEFEKKFLSKLGLGFLFKKSE
ncbi:diacylglyceryl transferase [Flavobacteriaceae bacterium S356]|uniref:Diacylglyceryl transferase n=1 Tax=Asprobacillus argus TaxID=3076534 RepID=A0ABU3LFE1_9FLAO|nr:diacylglyceryl transferase [Flavobacteriaceae bacterium S356]